MGAAATAEAVAVVEDALAPLVEALGAEAEEDEGTVTKRFRRAPLRS